MDGIIIVNKPIGVTSRDVVNKLTKTFNTKKMGHTGTLDPFASGVMLVTINKGTKISSYLENFSKQYIAELTLGKSTNTLDLDGEIIEEKEVKLPLDKKEVEKVLLSFIGEIEQIPPMFSAIKINGEELYKKARRGEEIKREPRKVFIEDIKLLSITKNKILFQVDCSKGTYIRTLGEEIARKLSYPGHLSMLTRTKVGKYKLSQAKNIEDISDKDIIPISDALSYMQTYIPNENEEFKVRNGVKLHLSGNDLIFIKSKDGIPLAIYARNDDGYYHSLRGLL